MKYIATTYDGGKEEVFVFPKTIDDEGMAFILGFIKNQTYGNWHRIKRKPVSAGSVDKIWECSGESEVLGIISRPVDTEILKRQLGENNGLKYIVTRDMDDQEELFIFPNAVHHDAMAELLSDIGDRRNKDRDQIYRKPIAAGFVDSNWKCHGRSETLGLESRAVDTEILARQIQDT